MEFCSFVRRVCCAAALLLAGSAILHAAPQQPTPPAIALINVNVIPMDGERVETDRAVLVQGDRIAAIGARDAVPIPTGAVVIDGGGRYLVPGLTDAHVHLEGDGTGGTTRPDFGDAPLYLAHGVTTVVNLRGFPIHLEWRRRIEAGQLLAPTIYTSGDFINEPRVNTPDDVEREVRAQARDGYDLIKFHEIRFTPGGDTTVGLSRESYLRMNEVAREIGIPLVGHAPVNLGLDVLLEARQPLAHLGMLSNIHFLPLEGNRMWLRRTAVATVLLVILAIANGVARIVRGPRGVARLGRLLAIQAMAIVLAIACGVLLFPGGPLFGSVTLRLAFTLAILMMVPATVWLVVRTIAIFRHRDASPADRVQAAVASSASVLLASAALAFWMPVAWRSTDAGIDRLAKRTHDAGIPVMTTLVVYDAIGGPGQSRLADDPTIDSLSADVRTRWRSLSQAAMPGYRYTDFMKQVAGALHRAGVTLIAGTDAMGMPLVAPGSALHRELELLVGSGLTPYEAMRTATVAPASFLRKDKEFGTVAVGRRADLLLVDGNPLEDVTRLRRPVGVMVRGRWITREQLRQMLTALGGT